MKKHLLLMTLFVNIINAQLPNDCINAVKICGNGIFTSNPSGMGNLNEINSCGSFESNSIWLKVTIAQGGTLGFNIIPLNTDLIIDYDFWVYGVNNSCSSLGEPIRCCTTNPIQAGLVNNITGMIPNTIVTTSGPGGNGSGYVRWLQTNAGQTYYIAIDRKIGNGGFELYWTGTAILATAPIANVTNDFTICSSTPDVGLFNLDAKRNQINSDLTNNTVDFFTTYANAVNNISSLPNIVANASNPQLIYARVTDNITGCFSIVDFNLVVNDCLDVDLLTLNALNGSAYPNPFNNEFLIDIATTNQELLQINVYDMLGKLIEQRKVSASEILSQKWGQNYPSGIYNILVRQENDFKSFRVLKQ